MFGCEWSILRLRRFTIFGIHSVHDRKQLVHQRVFLVHRMSLDDDRKQLVHQRVFLVHRMSLDDDRMSVSLSADFVNAERPTQYVMREGQ